MSSAVFKQAAEDLAFIAKRFHGLVALADYLGSIESPQDLEANSRRLKAESSTLIANMRKQAEDEAKKTAQADVEAAKLEAARVRKEAAEERTRLINQGQAEANRILADARKAAEQLDARVKKARAHVDEALR